jgi:hypothetical protein
MMVRRQSKHRWAAIETTNNCRLDLSVEISEEARQNVERKLGKQLEPWRAYAFNGKEVKVEKTLLACFSGERQSDDQTLMTNAQQEPTPSTTFVALTRSSVEDALWLYFQPLFSVVRAFRFAAQMLLNLRRLARRKRSIGKPLDRLDRPERLDPEEALKRKELRLLSKRDRTLWELLKLSERDRTLRALRELLEPGRERKIVKLLDRLDRLDPWGTLKRKELRDRLVIPKAQFAADDRIQFTGTDKPLGQVMWELRLLSRRDRTLRELLKLSERDRTLRELVELLEPGPDRTLRELLKLGRKASQEEDPRAAGVLGADQINRTG